MKAEDVIFYKPARSEKLRQALQKEVERALVSFPFWANRIKIKNVKFGIHNYLKNRLSGNLFALFAEEKNLDLDFKAGERPFPHDPMYDFGYGNTAWHIQNNFVQNRKPLPADEYVYLPALIPNRFKADKWSKRNEHPEGHDSTEYLFTFLNEDPDKNKRMFELPIDHPIINFLDGLKSEYGGEYSEKSPYSENWFWNEFLKTCEIPKVKLNHTPTLVIAGVAQENHFGYFADTDEKANLCYRLYRGKWYENMEEGGLSFCNGLIQTRIKNATCPMAALASFQAVFLKNGKKEYNV